MDIIISIEPVLSKLLQKTNFQTYFLTNRLLSPPEYYMKFGGTPEEEKGSLTISLV